MNATTMRASTDMDADADALEPPTLRSRIRRIVGSAVLLLVVAALVAWAAVQTSTMRDRHSRDDDRAAAVAAARSEVEILTSVTAAGAEGQIAKLLDGATASFKANLNQFATALRQALQQGKVTSEGTVAESGVVSQSADEVVVLVAVSAEVKNSNVPSGERRNYRLKVDMQKAGGRWLVSDLAFVP